MRRLLLLAFGASLAAACEPEPSAAQRDRARYLEVLGNLELLPDAGFALCDAIVAEQLRGDCSLVLGRRMAIGGSDVARMGCPRVLVGVWQDECWFAGAEAAGLRGQADEAADLCSRSGAFWGQCDQHLLEQLLRVQSRLVEGGDLALADLRFDELVASRLVRLARPARDRIRAQWFAMVMEHAASADAIACAPVRDVHRESCEIGAAAAARLLR